MQLCFVIVVFVLQVTGIPPEISVLTSESLPSEIGMLSTLVKQTSRDLSSVITYTATNAYQTLSILSSDILPSTSNYTWDLYSSEWTSFIPTASTFQLGIVNSELAPNTLEVKQLTTEAAGINLISNTYTKRTSEIKTSISTTVSKSKDSVSTTNSLSGRETISVSSSGSDTTKTETSKTTGFSSKSTDYSSALKIMNSPVFSTFSNYMIDTPDRTSVISYGSNRSSFNFITQTDSIFSTESYQRDSSPILGTLRTQTAELISSSRSGGNSSSEIISAVAMTIERGSEALISSFFFDTSESVVSKYETSKSMLYGLSTDQITPTLSSSSNTYDLPVTLTKHSGSISPETVLYSSEPIFSTFSSSIQSKAQNGIGTSVYASSSDIAGLTTHAYQGYSTSGFYTMSSSASPTVHPAIRDLQRQISDLKDTEERYMIVVIVLVLVIVLFIILIILYAYRRRQYYIRKQLTMRGIVDADLLEDGAKMRSKNYFDVGQTDNFRLSGRISTASLGSRDNEPLHLLDSFNRNRERQSLETTEEADDQVFNTDKLKDEEL